MKLEPGMQVTYFPPYRWSGPVAAVVVRDDFDPAFIIIRKETYPHPIRVKRDSLKEWHESK